MRRATALLASLAAALTLASCGGGTSQVVRFTPERVLLLGDETMLVVDDGTHDGWRYGINDRTGTTGNHCSASPSFAQSIVTASGTRLAACNADATAETAFQFGRLGATVEDATNGLAAQIAAVPGGLTSKDMFALYIGVHDVVALWKKVAAGALTADQAHAEARRLGQATASQVNALLATGARGIVLTTPNLALSPWGRAQQAASPGADAVIAKLSYEYNAELRISIDQTRYDGRHYALVLVDDAVGAIANLPTGFLASPYDVANAACDLTKIASVLECSTTTLVTNATISSHLWADELRLAPAAHYRIGLQAANRVLYNPF